VPQKRCYFCNDIILGIPRKCPLCGEYFCKFHRNFWNHECVSLPKRKKKVLMEFSTSFGSSSRVNVKEILRVIEEEQPTNYVLYQDKIASLYSKLSRPGLAIAKYADILEIWSDNPEIFHKIDNMALLDTKPLVNLTKEYHNNVCTDYACIDYTKSNVIHLFIEPYMNYYYATMKLYRSEHKFRSSLIGFGINFRFISSRYNLLCFITGIHYSKNHFSGIGTMPHLSQ